MMPNIPQSALVALVGVILVSLLSGTATPILAQEDNLLFSPVKMDFRIHANDTVEMIFSAVVSNQGSASLNQISIRIDSLSMSILDSMANDTEVISNLFDRVRYSQITVILPDSLTTGQSTSISLRLLLDDIVTINEAIESTEYLYKDFLMYIRPLHPYQNLTLSVELPEQAVLSEVSVTPLFPTPSSNSTDGLSQTYVWEIDELLPGQERVFISKYQQHIFDNAIIHASPVWVVLLSLLGLIVGIPLGYYGPAILERIRNVGTVRIVGTTSEEEEVVEAIRRKGGSCPQKELYMNLDMSQSKVSILLTNLEERGLVKRMKDGRENYIHLIEK